MSLADQRTATIVEVEAEVESCRSHHQLTRVYAWSYNIGESRTNHRPTCSLGWKADNLSSPFGLPPENYLSSGALETFA
jgi:hypothetical protein